MAQFMGQYFARVRFSIVREFPSFTIKRKAGRVMADKSRALWWRVK